MASDANELIADAFTSHSIDLQRLDASIRKRAVATLRKLEQELRAELLSSEASTTLKLQERRNRLETLLNQTKSTIFRYYKQAEEKFAASMHSLPGVEDEFTRFTINGIAGVDIATVAMSPEQLRAVFSNVIIEGVPFDGLWSAQSDYVKRKFAERVRMGVLRGEPTTDIAASLKEGVFARMEQDAETIVRTSITAVSDRARLDTYANNSDVVKYIQQRSTLDIRTSDICRAYSGKVWENDKHYSPVGHRLPFNGGPPRHWRCRSTLVPVLRSLEEMAGLVQRKSVSREYDDMFRKNLREQGFTKDDIAAIKLNSQASMTGQVAEDLTYEQWLKKQPVAMQQRALGESKYDLWKAGKIHFEDLVDRSGDPLTIEQLQEKVRRKRRAA